MQSLFITSLYRHVNFTPQQSVADSVFAIDNHRINNGKVATAMVATVRIAAALQTDLSYSPGGVSVHLDLIHGSLNSRESVLNGISTGSAFFYTHKQDSHRPHTVLIVLPTATQGAIL